MLHKDPLPCRTHGRVDCRILAIVLARHAVQRGSGRGYCKQQQEEQEQEEQEQLQFPSVLFRAFAQKGLVQTARCFRKFFKKCTPAWVLPEPYALEPERHFSGQHRLTVVMLFVGQPGCSAGCMCWFHRQHERSNLCQDGLTGTFVSWPAWMC